MLNETHDPSLRSWITSANEPGSDFPIQSLPFGVFSESGGAAKGRVGVAIGDRILDVTRCVDEGLIDGSPAARACAAPALNQLMSLDPAELSQLRNDLNLLLREGTTQALRAEKKSDAVLLQMSSASMRLPAQIGDYTDFYASVHHATNVGSMFRPDNPLLPNYKYVPIGYHGRASSIVASGTSVQRPSGQTKSADADRPSFGPSRMLDYEAELGFFVGQGNGLGQPISIDDAASHIFGFCLVNDWSARDIQAWEYQPLGPFLAKNFATSVSPWVITAEAAEPYRVAAALRPAGDPEPLPYLASAEDAARGGIAAFLEVYLVSSRMRDDRVAPVRLSRAPFAGMYWTVAQMLTHHASNGCNLRSGDLLASGTVSGDSPDSRGCLLELTWRGTKPLTLPTGEERRFLEDGDQVIMKAYLEAPGRPRIGLGECSGTILPAAEGRSDRSS
ncbi:MAG: fumarylacetoacetase [Gemmatimonadales bacterium]